MNLLRSAVFNSWDPMDCSSLGSSVHGISQARMLEGVSISSSRESSPPRDQTRISCFSRISRQLLLPVSYLGSPTFCLFLKFGIMCKDDSYFWGREKVWIFVWIIDIAYLSIIITLSKSHNTNEDIRFLKDFILFFIL